MSSTRTMLGELNIRTTMENKKLGNISVMIDGTETIIQLPAEDIIDRTGQSLEQIINRLVVLENFNGLPDTYRETLQQVQNDIVTIIGYIQGLKGVTPVSSGGTGADNVADARSNLGVAPVESPSFTGVPTSVTPNVSSDNNEIATTSFVKNVFANGVTFVPR